MKNYNVAALRGEDMSDAQHADAMGIVVPEEILNTPKYNDYVLDHIRDQNITHYQTELNPKTDIRYTQEEATVLANKQREAAKKNIDKLMSKVK